ncbi:TipC family immunity protein [Streptococcus cuniculi]|nr:TipC family immunity protein [Streptococcus cuniculi]
MKPYGLDANWIREKSDYMLYDVVLKRWFEKGSQRYSFDNLGNVKIERLDIFR